jgi:centromeric protein E
LQPSLSGDALISVICTISPSYLNQAESLSTLSFASGLKKVLLRAQRKEQFDPQALIQQYQNEIAELRAQLREKGTEGATSNGARGDNDEAAKRLEELKSLILNKSNVNEDRGAEVSPQLIGCLSLMAGSTTGSSSYEVP